MIPEPGAPRLDGVAFDDVADVALEDDATIANVAVEGMQAIGAQGDAIEVTTSRFKHARLSGAQLTRLRAIDVVFEDCDLAGAVLSEANLVRVEMHRCRLSDATLSDARLADVRFVDCTFTETNLRMSAFERVRFEDCDLRAADFYAAKLKDSAWLRCRLDGVEVTKAKFERVALHGSRIEDAPIKGASALQGAIIANDQVIPLLPSLIAALGITVDDDYLTRSERTAPSAGER